MTKRASCLHCTKAIMLTASDYVIEGVVTPVWGWEHISPEHNRDPRYCGHGSECAWPDASYTGWVKWPVSQGHRREEDRHMTKTRALSTAKDIEIAKALGRKAYANGVPASFGADDEFCARIMDAMPGERTPEIRGWVFGWHEAALAAAIETDDETVQEDTETAKARWAERVAKGKS